jgi:hypothetical protein
VRCDWVNQEGDGWARSLALGVDLYGWGVDSWCGARLSLVVLCRALEEEQSARENSSSGSASGDECACAKSSAGPHPLVLGCATACHRHHVHGGWGPMDGGCDFHFIRLLQGFLFPNLGFRILFLWPSTSRSNLLIDLGISLLWLFYMKARYFSCHGVRGKFYTWARPCMFPRG